MSYSCYDSCPSKSFQEVNASNFLFCRDGTYFVDPSSNSSIELGTFEYPYKRLVAPFREIFNFDWNNSRSLWISLKQGTTIQLNSVIDPILIVSDAPIIIQSYGQIPTFENNPQIISNYTSTTKNILGPNTTYLPWASEILSYQFVKAQVLGKITAQDLTQIMQKFQIVRSNVSFLNINFTEDKQTPFVNIYFYLSGQVFISFDGCGIYYWINYMVQGTDHPQVVSIRNSKVSLTRSYLFVTLENFYIGDCECPTCHQSLLVENNYIYGNPTIIYYGFGPLILRNNTFFGFGVAATVPSLSAYSLTDYLCITNIQQQVFLIENNVFDNNFKILFAGKTLKNPNIVNTLNLIFRSNQVRNLQLNSNLLSLDSETSSQLNFTDNIFDSFSMTSQNIILAGGSLASAFVSNNTFTNSVLDSGFNLNVLQSTFISNTFINISSTTNQKSVAIIQIQSNQILSIRNTSVLNSQIRYTNLITIVSTSSILIDSLFLTSVSIEQRDLILISDYINLSINNIVADFVTVNPNIYSVVNFNIISSASVSALTNLTLTNSGAPLLMMNQILNRDDQQILFLLDNITISNSSVTSTYGFLNFGTFVYPLFSFTISNLTLMNSSMQNSFIVSEMIGSIEITESIFNTNYGIIAQLQPFAINNQQKQSTLLIKNCSFIANNGSANALLITQTNSVIQIVKSSFAGNFGTGRGTIGFADKSGSLIEAENSTFENNYGMLGGVFFSHMDSVISSNNCLFRSNFACYGGVAYINDEGIVQMTNSTFQNNSALVGNVLYLINSNELSILDTSNFVGNRFTVLQNRQFFINTVQSNPQALFEYFDISFVLKLQNLKQIDQLAFQEDYLVNTQKSSIQILWDQTFSDETHFILALAGSSVDFIDVTIRNTSLINVISAALSEVSFVRTNLENISDITHNSYLLDFQVGCLVTINSTHLHSFNTRSMISLEQSEVIANQVNISNIWNNQTEISPILISKSSLVLIGSKFRNITSLTPMFSVIQSSITFDSLSANQIQSVLIEAFQSSVFIQDSIISYQQSSSSGLVIVDKGYAFFNSSSFYNCSTESGYGGILNLHGQMDQLHSIINCSFENNSALEGGVLFAENANLDIRESNFVNNTASKNGGALYLSCSSLIPSNCKTLITESAFAQNRAEIQGGAISYDLIQPNLISVNLQNNIAPYGPDIASYPTSLQIIASPSNIRSGTYIKGGELILSLIDQDNQVVLSADNIEMLVYFQNPNYTLMGTTSFSSINGTYDVSNIALKGQPGSQVLLYFHSKAINPDKYEVIFNQTNTDFGISMPFLDCVDGEILKDFQCQICLPGTYQLEAGESKCNKCLQNAVCQGGSQISLHEGYWRGNTSSVSLYPCLVASACPGGQNISCAEGYQGVLCHDCVGQTTSGYYARSSIDKCAKCGNMGAEYLKLLSIIISLIIYVMIMVAMIVRSPSRDKDSSVLLRILTNYFQTIQIISTLSLNWPPQITNFLNNFTFLTSSTSKFFNVGCLLQTKLPSNLNLFAVQSLVLAVLPFLFMIFATAMWKFASLVKPNLFLNTYKRNIYTTVFVFLFLVYSSITSSCFQMFSCVEIDGVYLLARELTIECWTPEHRFIILTIGLPILAIWVVGFPVIIFVILFRNRHRLNEPEILLKYGLFYIGLQDKAFYWEIVVINIRKVVCTAIAVCMTQKNSYKLVLVCVLFLIINETLAGYIQPYQKQMLNNVEKASLFVSVLTILLGIFFLQQSSENEFIILTGIFITVLILNFTFLLYWFVQMVAVIYRSIYTYLKKKNLLGKTSLEIEQESPNREDSINAKSDVMQQLDITPIQDHIDEVMAKKQTNKKQSRKIPTGREKLYEIKEEVIPEEEIKEENEDGKRMKKKVKPKKKVQKKEKMGSKQEKSLKAQF